MPLTKRRKSSKATHYVLTGPGLSFVRLDSYLCITNSLTGKSLKLKILYTFPLQEPEATAPGYDLLSVSGMAISGFAKHPASRTPTLISIPSFGLPLGSITLRGGP
jgi:hypothetical protein